MTRAEMVEEVVCDYFNTTLKKIMVKKRHSEVVYPRQLCHYFLRKYSTMTLQAIGRRYNRDHSSVIHSIVTINNLLFSDERVKRDVQALSTKISRRFIVSPYAFVGMKWQSIKNNVQINQQ